MALIRGQLLGPYEILEPIGAGGMGEVYRARDPRLGREVAIKVLPAGGAGDAEAPARFQRESRAIASLSHPNLLAVYDVGVISEITFIVTELLAGETLRARLLRERIDTRSCAQIIRAVALGLAAAHDRGLVHRDIKPENIFLTRSGEVKVLDFGLVKAAAPRDEAGQRDTDTHSVLTDPGWLMGTPGYMAPEQIQGVPVDHRADLFAVGAVLYEMLCGERAFKGPTTAETIAATLRDAPPALPASDPRQTMLARIAERCLEKQASRRFQNALDLAFAVETALGEAPTPAPGNRTQQIPWAAALGRPSLFRWIAWGATLVIGAFVGYALSRPTRSDPPIPERVSIGLGRIFGGRFAPGGASIFYAASLSGPDPEIYEVRPDSRDRRTLGLAPATLLAVSARNELAIKTNPSFPLTYYQPGTLAVAPPSGAAVRSLVPLVNTADWTPDGRELVAARREGSTTRVEWPVGHTVLETDGIVSGLRVSPQGDRAAFFVTRETASVQTITPAGVVHVLARDLVNTSGGLAFHPSGELWFTGERIEAPPALRAIDARGRERVVARDSRGLVLQDIASDGRVLLMASTFRAEVHLEREQQPADVSIDIESTLEDMAEDGALLINDRRDLFLRTAQGSVTRVFDSALRFRSRLSPAGRWFVAVPLRNTKERPNQIVLAPTGLGETQTEDLGGLSLVASPTWRPDETGVLFTTAAAPSGGFALQRIRRNAKGLEKLLDLPAAGRSVLISPDGRTASVQLPDPTPDSSAFLFLDLQSGRSRELRTGAAVGYQNAWTDDARSLYCYIQGEIPAVIRRIDVGSGKVAVDRTIRLADPRGVWRVHPIRINSTGRLISYTLAREVDDLYVYSGLR